MSNVKSFIKKLKVSPVESRDNVSNKWELEVIKGGGKKSGYAVQEQEKKQKQKELPCCLY